MKTIVETRLMPGVQQLGDGSNFQVMQHLDDRGNEVKTTLEPYVDSRTFEVIPGSMANCSDRVVVHEPGQEPRDL